jgi:hypothetical protein
MTTIATPQFNALIDQLLAESKAAMPDRSHPFFQLSEARQDKLMASKTEYLDFYRSLKDMPLAVSRETGMLLYMLVRANQALSIVEFGTSFGVSALHLAAALKDNGGGHLLTTEFEPSKVERARANLASAGLLDLVEIRQRRLANPGDRSAGPHRPAVAGRRQGPVSRSAASGRAPSGARRPHHRRRRSLQPGIPGLHPFVHTQALSMPLDGGIELPSVSREQTMQSTSPAPGGANVFLTLAPITLAVFIAFLTIGIQLPVLPLHLHDTLGMGPGVVGLVVGAQFAAALLSRAWAGNFADMRGAKRAVITGALTASASGLIYLASLAFVDAPVSSVWVLVAAACCWHWVKA